ncbi:hypothetical protein GQ43DRAFT_274841 [Delitschia confertaspora ATCC 74209]|uniref:Uncharacterized protein n=1 Tax=Delitschia confertaspora ATCC 74209 TaxID=1513339 RepID=A0A9P4JS11_9PLEO|nr:hypothetical protein GQ43DRAFT_274841 [Delitschia confertaspora ATCC 74209]
MLSQKTKTKTYNSQDSHVVTHRNTNGPVRSLSTADRTGSPIFSYLWSYVLNFVGVRIMRLVLRCGWSRRGRMTSPTVRRNPSPSEAQEAWLLLLRILWGEQVAGLVNTTEVNTVSILFSFLGWARGSVLGDRLLLLSWEGD